MSRRHWELPLAVVFLATAGWAATRTEKAAPWVRVEYAGLVDGRRLTHSGEAVGSILARLAGRARPPAGDTASDGLDHRLLDPILERYAFVLPDAIDATRPPHDPPLVDIGDLWEPGGVEPAWVELCRARRLLVESDGAGFLRVFLPASGLDALPFDDALPALAPETVAEEAWKEAWPVLRHVLAAERRRLGRVRKSATPPALDVEVHAYRHLVSRSAFVVSSAPWKKSVASTAAEGGARPLDLAPLRAILERELTIEGARLEPSGRLRWLTAEPDRPPRILGSKVGLADLAVAYRAVAHGGYGEAYMSLDRASAPHTAEVNYGGRLRDTALGMVSLLSDVRFKTFSVGIDLLGEGDARASVRQALPAFRTHLERFAADPTAGMVLNQQTRFWFYPDDVDLTLSSEGDVLAFRRLSMAAASERVEDAAARAADPTWTRAMVAYLNEHHAELAAVFPEIASLDESVRYLALFTWLSAARGRGLPVPDLDVLLDVALPAVPTPRRFPQLLSYDVLAPPGATDPVLVFDRTPIGDALDRLRPREGRPTPAEANFRRALSQLDRRVPDQAALAAEMEAAGAAGDAWTIDRLAYRADRLLLHARVLATLPAADRAVVEARRNAAPATRVFSVGIGGIDLGMSAVLARASAGSARMGLGAPSTAPRAGEASPAPAGETAATPAPDPASAPGNELPDHGLGRESERVLTRLEPARGEIAHRAGPGTIVRRGVWKPEKGAQQRWTESVGSIDGPEARMRRAFAGASGSVFERLEEGRFLAYRFEGSGTTLRAAPAARPVPDQALGPPAPAEPAGAPEGVVLLDLSAATEPASVALRVRAAPDRQLSADVPRGLLQRLVLGREADSTPERPLAAFTPARQVLGGARTMMVLQTRDETTAPWKSAVPPRGGEEDAARIARALTLWWGADPANDGAVAVVGTSSGAPSRWSGAPRLDAGAVVVDAEGGEKPPSARAIVLISTEAPGVLGRRLRALARDPSMTGKILAVAPLGGPVRGDLPASLLAEGNLAAIGIAEELPRSVEAARAQVRSWAVKTGEGASKGKRPEDVPGPFTWYY